MYTFLNFLNIKYNHIFKNKIEPIELKLGFSNKLGKSHVNIYVLNAFLSSETD